MRGLHFFSCLSVTRNVFDNMLDINSGIAEKVDWCLTTNISLYIRQIRYIIVPCQY